MVLETKTCRCNLNVLYRLVTLHLTQNQINAVNSPINDHNIYSYKHTHKLPLYKSRTNVYDFRFIPHNKQQLTNQYMYVCSIRKHRQTKTEQPSGSSPDGVTQSSSQCLMTLV